MKVGISAITDKHPFPNNYPPNLLTIARGEGCSLFDTEGREYLDFASGIGVNILGHGNRDIRTILYEQTERIIHASNLYTTQPALELGQRLLGTGDFAAVHLGNSGSEANEAAIKYARLYSRRTKGENCYKILSFRNGFHGRTLGSLAATASQTNSSTVFGPLPGGFYHAPYNNPELLSKLLDGEFAAVIVEPIQGEGGLEVMSREFAEELNALCRRHDILLIADEVQTGLGRTGSFYASAKVGLQPDITTLAKPLAGGVPLSATLIPDRVNALINLGEHGTTFGGGPLACSVALHIVDTVQATPFLQHVQERGRFLEAGLLALSHKHSIVGRVMGLGLMRGVELKDRPTLKQALLPTLLDEARDAGLLLLKSGSNVVRLLPPLVVTECEIQHGLDILDTALSKISI